MPGETDWLAGFKPHPLHHYLDKTVAEYGAKKAVDFFGLTWSWSEVGAMVDKVAARLQAMGVAKGVQVGLCLPNTPYYPVFYFAVLKIGGTVVNYNPLYVERELSFQVEDSRTSIMVTLDLKAIYDKVEAVRAKGLLSHIIVCPMADILPQPKRLLFRLFKRKEMAAVRYDGAHIAFADMLASSGSLRPVDIDPQNDIAVLQYTGGTTGTPKGAMLTHANLCANTEQVRAAFPGAKRGEERLLALLPFFHVFAMTVVQNYSVAIGAQMVLMPRLDMGLLFKTITRTKPTLFPGVPTIYTAILNAPQAKTTDLGSIRFCLSGGAPLPVEVKEQFESLTGCKLVEGYGLTESSPVVSVNPPEGVVKAGSIGMPVVGTEVQIRDLEDKRKVLEQGGRGEVAVRGPQVMKGYWERPGESGATLVDGWLMTGDVGYIDEDGYIFLVDRIKDLILCSGYNVYPRVVEEALYQHPDVVETIVIAVTDKYRGQAPKAFVKRAAGSQITADELMAFLRDQISKIEMPREIEFRDELPKTMVGKLSKKELIEEEAEKASKAEG
ncbi:MAG: dicarboxylate--CoA ligase PimA [Hyphomicrobiales bacterium]|nr:MAG: dicarboxylate--CoA ligase PimA [Hyphomicrobiales bacterium]